MSSTSPTHNDGAAVAKPTRLSICQDNICSAVVSLTETQTLQMASSSALHSSNPVSAKNKKHQRGARGKKGRNAKRSRSRGSGGDDKDNNEDKIHVDVRTDPDLKRRAINPRKGSPPSEAANEHICSHTEEPSKPSRNVSKLAPPQIIPTRSLRSAVDSSEGAGVNELSGLTFSFRFPYQLEAVTHPQNTSSYSAKRKKKRRISRNNKIVGDHPRGDAERTGENSVSKDELKDNSCLKPWKTARELRTANFKQSSIQVSLSASSYRAITTASEWYCEYCDVRTTERLLQHNVTLGHLRNVDHFQKNVLQPMIESCTQRTANYIGAQSDLKTLHCPSLVECDSLRNSCLGVGHVGAHVHNPTPVPPKGLECDMDTACEEFVTTPSLAFALRSSSPCVYDVQTSVGPHLCGLVQRPALTSHYFTLNGFPLPPPIVEMAESAGDASVASLEMILADSEQDMTGWGWKGSALDSGRDDTLFSFIRRQGELTALGSPLRSATVGLSNSIPKDKGRSSLFHVNVRPSMPYPSVVSRKDIQSWRTIVSDVQSSFAQKIQPQSVLL